METAADFGFDFKFGVRFGWLRNKCKRSGQPQQRLKLTFDRASVSMHEFFISFQSAFGSLEKNRKKADEADFGVRFCKIGWWRSRARCLEGSTGNV